MNYVNMLNKSQEVISPYLYMMNIAKKWDMQKKDMKLYPIFLMSALMILYELLGKPPSVAKKVKSQKSPVPPQKKSDDIPGTGAALDRVRSQLRRDALKARQSQKPK